MTAAAVRALRDAIDGDEGYDEARLPWQRRFDPRPALVAEASGPVDVRAAISTAREHDLPLVVQATGHGAVRSADGALLLKTNRMTGVEIDPERRVARVGGGALWSDVLAAAAPYGLGALSGSSAGVGVAGYTLGGGAGWLSRLHGFAADSLLSADVVTADGELLTADAEQLPDLFWALRGGGGNFGVVVSFSFSLQEVSEVLAGPTLWPMEAAPAVMRAFDTYMATAPEIVGGFFLFLEVPPDPSFPAELHGRRMCGIAWCVTDPDATDVFDDLLAAARPELHGVQRMPFPAWNSAFDGLYPPGHQWYWRADFVRELSDEAIALHVEHAERLPTMQSSMHLYPVNGAAARVSRDATAWAYRDARYGQVIVGVDPDPANAGLLRDWSVAYHEALHPHSMGGAYVNRMMEEGQDRVRASYRDHYDRLAEVKATYDPGNLFRVNQNIAPAGR